LEKGEADGERAKSNIADPPQAPTTRGKTTASGVFATPRLPGGPDAAEEGEKEEEEDSAAGNAIRATAAAAAARAVLARIMGLPSADILVAEIAASLASPERRRVSFDEDANTVHEITPYSEIYGLHPREFVFGRDFRVLPALGGCCLAPAGVPPRTPGRAATDEDDECGESSDSDDDEGEVEEGVASDVVQGWLCSSC